MLFPGVVDENIKMPKFIHCLLYGLLAKGFIANVPSDRCGAAALFFH